MELEFRGQYDKASFYRSVAFYLSPAKGNAALRIGMACLLAALVIGYSLFTMISGSFTSSQVLHLIKYWITVPLLIGYILWPYIGYSSTASKMWKSPKVHTIFSGVISNRGISYNSKSDKPVEIAWENYFRKLVRNDLIVLVGNDGKFDCFPRSFFSSDEDWRKVQEIIRFYVKEPE